MRSRLTAHTALQYSCLILTGKGKPVPLQACSGP